MFLLFPSHASPVCSGPLCCLATVMNICPFPVSQLFLGEASKASEPESHNCADPVLGKPDNIV